MMTLGAVGYLNALPLVHGLDRPQNLRVIRKVPSALLEDLEGGRLDAALCPVIDVQRSRRELVIVPAGGIGSRARTLTVRVFSRRPLPDVRHIWADGDSHTSVALAQIVFQRLYGSSLEVLPLKDPSSLEENRTVSTALLIGDKVVTAEPSESRFPYQLDLGQAWRDITGRPFVFAAWLAPAGLNLGALPTQLEELRLRNMADLEDMVPAWAEEHGWPADLALTYLRDLLDYEINGEHLAAIEFFWRECAEFGLINDLRPLKLYETRVGY